MAFIPEESNTDRPRTVAEEVRVMRKELDTYKKGEQTEKETKPWKFPFKWTYKFGQAKKKNSDTALVLFFNKKNEIEAPMFMPIFSGNMIVYKNKAYEFDPRAVWRMKAKGYPMVYCIKETDRRPIQNKRGELYYKDAAISNQDMDEIRARGDSTESDEFLIKAALKAQTTTLPGGTNWIIGAVIVAVIIGGLIWVLSSGMIK